MKVTLFFQSLRFRETPIVVGQEFAETVVGRQTDSRAEPLFYTLFQGNYQYRIWVTPTPWKGSAEVDRKGGGTLIPGLDLRC